jgi:hypothetical protein
MNNLIFLNHSLLFNFDHSLRTSPLFTEYLAIYQFFPDPPGIEYFNPRNMIVDLNGPWKLDPTATPLPALPSTPITFDEAADDFGSKSCQELDQGRQVYLMWSGGIDSTAVAVSILKHIKPSQYSNLHVVLSDFSQRENPIFYHKFLSQFDQIELSNFDPARIDLSNSLILDGEGGDQAYGSSAANKIFSLHPEKILLPWRKNLDFLHNYWYKDSMPEFWDWLLELMNKTIDHGPALVETCFDWKRSACFSTDANFADVGSLTTVGSPGSKMNWSITASTSAVKANFLLAYLINLSVSIPLKVNSWKYAVRNRSNFSRPT